MPISLMTMQASIVSINESLANIDVDVAALNKVIDDLKLLVGQGMTPDQVTEAQSLLDQAKAKAKSIADETPDVVVDPPVV